MLDFKLKIYISQDKESLLKVVHADGEKAIPVAKLVFWEPLVVRGVLVLGVSKGEDTTFALPTNSTDLSSGAAWPLLTTADPLSASA